MRGSTFPGAPPPGGGIQKQVNGLGSHLPMLQCARSLPAKRQRDAGTRLSSSLISYFIGSLMGAMIVGKLRGGVDIRTMGSGNAGGTNAFRTQGVLFALGVVIVDVGKGVIGAGVVPGLDIPFVPRGPRNFPHVADAGLRSGCSASAMSGRSITVSRAARGRHAGRDADHSRPKLIIVVLLVWGSMLVRPVMWAWPR